MSPSNDAFSASIIPFQMPEHMRAFAEKGVWQARENYSRLRDAAENGNGAIEAFLANASKGSSDYVAKILEIMAVNTNAGFDFVQQLAGAKSVTEGMELWTSHLRSQAESWVAQAQELAELGQRIATDTFAPVKSSVSKITPIA